MIRYESRRSFAGIGVIFSSGALAQQPPTPLSLASQLDLECHRAEGPALDTELGIRQLNPELQGLLPDQMTQLGALEEVCVPVAKDGNVPTADVLPLAKWLDLACYEATAPAVDVDVDLSHLNPVLANLPDESVKLIQLEQVCLPVAKRDPAAPDGPTPPQWVRKFVKYLDFACYSFEQSTSDVDFSLDLSHLNPVIRQMGLDDRQIRLRQAHELCVPIRKENQEIPDVVLQRLRWIDFLKYKLTPENEDAIPAFEQPITLELKHVNPIFDDLPGFQTELHAPLQLLVPVAKNGSFPPD